LGSIPWSSVATITPLKSKSKENCFFCYRVYRITFLNRREDYSSRDWAFAEKTQARARKDGIVGLGSERVRKFLVSIASPTGKFA
jgi:hypothetical protein